MSSDLKKYLCKFKIIKKLASVIETSFFVAKHPVKRSGMHGIR
jgi:hypothetical protein